MAVMQAAPRNTQRTTQLQRLRLQLMASERAAHIGTRLRARREELDLTRRELAREMDGLATENDIYRWESGKHRPQDDTLAALARALGKNYGWAVGEEPDSATPDLTAVLADESQLDRIEKQLTELAAAVDVLTGRLQESRAETVVRAAEVLKRIDALEHSMTSPQRQRRAAKRA